MKLSIIIPTYNSQETIKACIDSILCQIYMDYEILIMDGVSQDCTLNIARSFDDKRITIYSEKDKGVYDAMNKGILKSRGEWLYFLGSDDKLYDENVLKNIIREIEISNPDIIYGDVYFMKRKMLYDGEFTREKLTTQANICHQAIFYKRSLFNRLGLFNLDFTIYADWDFNIRCFSTPDLNIQYIEDTISFFNDEGGLSSSSLVDENFSKLPYSSFAYLKGTLRFLKEENVLLYNSLEYRIGRYILKPFRVFKRIFH